ncbi:MAG: hypothetical protein BGO98_14985 [Myxococcales bacterium 68-20]|nr:MAG: hypothetical protein BGO98_14985 [Myxococcales bacterium 68-20]
METLRVYSETLPYADLVRPRTIELLSRYGLELVLAVRPWDEPELPRVAQTLRDAGVPLSIWPMLSDEEGRWASMHNAPAFGRLTRSVCDALEAAGAPPCDVLFDLEPPFAAVRSLASLGAAGSRSPDGLVRFASGFARAKPAAFEAASQALARTVAEIHERGITTSMAVWPLVALDPPGEEAWQSLLGTPVDALGTRHVSVMVYTSILEGWSRRALRRRDTTELLAAATVRTMRRWGPSAGISLGCVGTGALADEPTYRDPSELAEDVAIARASGCEKLTLFDLGGVLSREPAEAWLDAFVSGGEARGGPTSKRVRAARTLARAAYTLVRALSPSARAPRHDWEAVK